MFHCPFKVQQPFRKQCASNYSRCPSGGSAKTFPKFVSQRLIQKRLASVFTLPHPFPNHSSIHSMIVGSRQERDLPPGRRRDAAPRGHLAAKLFKEVTPSPSTGGLCVMEGREIGEDPLVKIPSIYPNHPKKRVGGRSGAA